LPRNNSHASPPHRRPQPQDRQSPKALVAVQSVSLSHSPAAENPFPELAPERCIDTMILWGAWPGEEPVELLMEDLSVVNPAYRTIGVQNPLKPE